MGRALSAVAHVTGRGVRYKLALTAAPAEPVSLPPMAAPAGTKVAQEVCYSASARSPARMAICVPVCARPMRLMHIRMCAPCD